MHGDGVDRLKFARFVSLLMIDMPPVPGYSFVLLIIHR